jgi:uncharacterized protein YlxP (DUF503 family)
LSAFAGLVLIHLHFPDAGSLKGKRKELSSLKAQLQTRLHVAVSEVDHQDLWQRSTLAVAITAGTETDARRAIDRVDRFVAERCPQGHRMEATVLAFQEVL